MRYRWLLCLAAVAQMAGGGDRPDATVLKVTTRLVEVQVVVQDRHGQPLAGLKREDFLLKDGGQEQKIDMFAVESAKPDVPPAGAVAAPLPPGTFSNLRRADEPVSNTATVILLDKLNTRSSEQRFVKRKVLEFLKKADPNGRIAILALAESGRLRVLADFTTDTDKLQSAAAADSSWRSQLQRMSETDVADSGDVIADPDELAGLEGASDASRSAMATNPHSLESLKGRSAVAARGLNQKVAESANRVRIERTLRAMEAIARGLANVPGRKNLVWFSDAFPLSMGYEKGRLVPGAAQLNFEAAVTRSMRALTDANVAVYPVDPRGITSVAMADTGLGFSDDRYTGDVQANGTSVAWSVTQVHSSMDTMAKITGGRAY